MVKKTKINRARSTLRDPILARNLRGIKLSLEEIIGKDFQLFLFGSRARGNPAPDSDVDLMLILPEEKLSLELENQIRDLIYEFSLNAPYLFSVMIVKKSLAQARAGFQVFAAVEKEGISI